MACGATALKHSNGKYVLVVDRARMSLSAAQKLGQWLELPGGTPIVSVICNDGQSPESAFTLLEQKIEGDNG